MAPHFILEELGVPFELIKVDRNSNAQKSADYLALNPLGRIPTLVNKENDQNDLVIFESAAICIHLVEGHSNANLIPKVGDRDRAKFFQWMIYLTNTVQAELMVYFYPEKYGANAKTVTTIINRQEEKITALFALLDTELINKDFLIGNNLTACDYFLFMLAIWADELKKPPLAFENLSRYLCQLAKRDAIIKVCQTESFCLNDYL